MIGALLKARGWLGGMAVPIALAVLAMGALLYAVHRVEQRGYQKALDAVRKANDAAMDAADKAEQRVLTCPPGLWNRETRRCATKDLP